MNRSLKKMYTITLCLLAAAWIFTSDSPYPLITTAAVVIHEFGHVVGALLGGEGFSSLGLRTGGLLLSRKKYYSSYGTEALIALFGPLFNFLSAGICFSLFKTEHTLFFAGVSVALGTLNLLPVRSFDGGRIAEALLSRFLPCSALYTVCELLSFLSLFFLWSISVYAILKSGESITLFIFSGLLFAQMFLSQPKE